MTIVDSTTVDVPTRTATSRKPGEKRFGVGRIVAIAILVLMAAAWLLPFAWAIITSLKSESDASATPVTWLPPNGFTLDAYANVLAEGNIPIWAFNSLLTSVVITLITVAISALAAYALSRLDFAGRGWLYFVIIASIIIPPQVLIIPLFYEMLAFNMVDTYWGLILPQVVHPIMVFILKKFFDQIPVELEDAARVDGANRLRVFWTGAGAGRADGRPPSGPRAGAGEAGRVPRTDRW